MKKEYITLMIIVMHMFFIKTYADLGEGYRFYGEVVVKGEKVRGYFYEHSWGELNPGFSVLKLYKENNRKEVVVYPEIKTLTHNGTNEDFALKGSGIKIQLHKIIEINTYNRLKTSPDKVLILLTQKEYELITKRRVNFDYVHFKDYDTLVAENCFDLLISPKNKKELEAEAKILSDKLKQKIEKLGGNLEMENGGLYWKYFDAEKKKLLEKEIIVVTICNAL
ncbi:conserved protein of unknown function [Tenacibaculum sp. 190524A02b]|uniref:Uncharacterized protein n=1 Tax=Tenacibaculum vairaonense TaxID=3137860 RepID=A0ABP1F3N1_9FLAO